VIIRGLQPPIVESERLARRILQVELTIVAARQMLGRKAAGAVGIEAAVQEPAGIGRGHAA